LPYYLKCSTRSLGKVARRGLAATRPPCWCPHKNPSSRKATHSAAYLPPVPAGTVRLPYKRVVVFVDNAGADVVLGMLPLAREVLRAGSEVRSLARLPAPELDAAPESGGCLKCSGMRAFALDAQSTAARGRVCTCIGAAERKVPCLHSPDRQLAAHAASLPPALNPAQVVLVANSLPAINDVTAAELRSVVAAAAEVCPIIRAARDAAVAAQAACNGRVPPLPGKRALAQKGVLAPGRSRGGSVARA
jgi:hypothetical protein